MMNLGKRPSVEPHTGWEVTYGSFAMILLCFFVMVCSFVTFEEAKVARFVRSFSAVLKIFGGGTKMEEGPLILPPSPDMIEKDSPMSTLMHRVKEVAEKKGITGDTLELVMTERGLVLRLKSAAAFDLGSARLSSKTKELLKGIAPFLLEVENPIRIEGHTDNLPISTVEFPSNWELSTSRAVNVLRYLVEECSLPQHRLSAAGYGEYRPIAPNDREENRAKNRRVEIIILGQEPSRMDVR